MVKKFQGGSRRFSKKFQGCLIMQVLRSKLRIQEDSNRIKVVQKVKNSFKKDQKSSRRSEQVHVDSRSRGGQRFDGHIIRNKCGKLKLALFSRAA